MVIVIETIFGSVLGGAEGGVSFLQKEVKKGRAEVLGEGLGLDIVFALLNEGGDLYFCCSSH